MDVGRRSQLITTMVIGCFHTLFSCIVIVYQVAGSLVTNFLSNEPLKLGLGIFRANISVCHEYLLELMI